MRHELEHKVYPVTLPTLPISSAPDEDIFESDNVFVAQLLEDLDLPQSCDGEALSLFIKLKQLQSLVLGAFIPEQLIVARKIGAHLGFHQALGFEFGNFDQLCLEDLSVGSLTDNLQVGEALPVIGPDLLPLILTLEQK